MTPEQRLAGGATTLDAAIDTYVAGFPTKRSQRRWQRALGVAAAVVLTIGGLAGIAHFRSDVKSPALGSEVPDTSNDPTSGSLLTTPVPADVQPLVAMSAPGWVVDATTGFVPVTVEPSEECPGCGATRLVVMADGPLLAGPVFTAWSVSPGISLDRFAAAVSVGGFQGRATSSPAGTPVEQNRMTLAWPLGDGPGALTAMVDARGLSNEQVVHMAATLTWASSVPVMPARPAGFHQVEAPAPGATVESYLSMSTDGGVLEVYSTNGGVHGLVDWSSVGNVMVWGWEQRVIDGVSVALDAPAVDEQPIQAATVAWVAGGWGHVVIGHAFADEASFLNAVSALRLTDAASFAAATTGAPATDMPNVISSNGWDGAVQP